MDRMNIYLIVLEVRQLISLILKIITQKVIRGYLPNEFLLSADILHN